MFVRIAFARSQVEAGRLQSLLESGGFHPVPVNTSSHFMVGGAEQGYYVEIPKTEAKAAYAFLKEEGMAKCLVD